MSVNIKENDMKKQIQHIKHVLNEKQYRLYLGLYQ